MAVRKHSLNGKSMSEESKDALKNEKANEYLKSLFSQVTMDLPTIEDLEFLKSIEREKGYYTDLCKITACNEDIKYYFLRDDDDKENIHYGPNNSTIDLVNKGKINNNKYSRRDFAIRPVLDFSNCPELFDIIIKRQRNKINNDNEYGMVELGKYPQMVDTWHSISSNIKAMRKNRKILSYTFDKVLPTYLSSDFKPLNITAYKYNGLYSNNDYTIMEIRNLSSFYDKITHNLNEYSLGDGSTKRTFEEGRMVSVKVDSINWIVDSERKRLIAEKCLVSGIQFMRYDPFNGKEEAVDYSKSNVRWYMEKYMKEQMFQYTHAKNLGVTDLLYDLALEEEMNKHEEELEQEAIKKKELERKEGKQEEQRKKEITKEEVKKPVEENEKKKELTKLLEEIRDSKKYYLGNEDINKLVKEKYNSYIKELDELKKKIDNHDNSLVIKKTDPNYYYERLISELNDIVEKLREHSVKVKPIHEMLEILNECRKSTIDVNKDSLCKSIDETNNIILGLNVDQKTKTKLISRLDGILADNIERNKSYINAFKKNINAPTKTLDELKEELTKDLKPFNEHLNNVNNCNIMLNILLECQKDKIDITKDPICNSINNVKSAIFKFIILFDSNIKDSLNTELENIINKHINQVTKYLNDSLEGNSKSIALDDIKVEFATDFQPFLEKLKRIVDNIDVVNIILTETQEMIDSTFTQSKVAIVASYMDNINEIIEEIKNIGSSADIKEVKKLRSKLKQKFNVTESKDSIITTLREYIGELHKLRLIIIDRNKENEAIAKAKVDVDIEEILNGDTKSR